MQMLMWCVLFCIVSGVVAYSILGHITALYVESYVSFYLPYLAEERTLSMTIVLEALVEGPIILRCVFMSSIVDLQV